MSKEALEKILTCLLIFGIGFFSGVLFEHMSREIEKVEAYKSQLELQSQ